MEPEQRTSDRDTALRAMLVDRATRSAGRSVRSGGERLRVGVVTAVVLVAVVALSVLAIRIGGGGRLIAGEGEATSSPTSAVVLPSPTIPAGTVLGRWTSDGGSVQHHTIRPNGRAIALAIACTGDGEYFIHIPHVEDEGGGCGGVEGSSSGTSSGNKGVPGATTISIKASPKVRWTLTVVGIPETYVTPKPIPTPTDSSGDAVPYCTAGDLQGRFAAHAMPDGVTEVHGGELVFTNTTGATCALAGYPEVRFLSDGVALGHNTMNHTDDRMTIEKGLRAVIVQPGASAYSQIDWYLPDANEQEEGPCEARSVTDLQVDLAYDLSSPGQTGTLDVPIGSTVTACLNGAHGALGKYGQLSSTVFVDYSLTEKG
jgi:hypothetical protein